jgi:hypothetical protein
MASMYVSGRLAPRTLSCIHGAGRPDFYLDDPVAWPVGQPQIELTVGFCFLGGVGAGQEDDEITQCRDNLGDVAGAHAPALRASVQS